MAPRLVTTYSTLDWSADGTLVTKTRSPAFDARRRFRNELRVNRLLVGQPPPVATPSLVAFDVQRRKLTFTAVPAVPLGPKYPDDLAASTIDELVALAQRLRNFDPQRRRLRRFNAERRLRFAGRAGLLSDAEVADLLVVAAGARRRMRFGHGDLTARNVLGHGDAMVLIDWEWAGLYPEGYDLAFLWFSLGHVENGRDRVERQVDTDERIFLLSALLIELWHLQWYVPPEFRESHLATRDVLVARLCR